MTTARFPEDESCQVDLEPDDEHEQHQAQRRDQFEERQIDGVEQELLRLGPDHAEHARTERDADEDLADDHGLLDLAKEDADESAEHQHDHEAQQEARAGSVPRKRWQRTL